MIGGVRKMPTFASYLMMDRNGLRGFLDGAEKDDKIRYVEEGPHGQEGKQTVGRVDELSGRGCDYDFLSKIDPYVDVKVVCSDGRVFTRHFELHSRYIGDADAKTWYDRPKKDDKVAMNLGVQDFPGKND